MTDNDDECLATRVLREGLRRGVEQKHARSLELDAGKAIRSGRNWNYAKTLLVPDGPGSTDSVDVGRRRPGASTVDRQWAADSDAQCSEPAKFP